MIAVALTCTASTAEVAVPRIVMIAIILPNIVPVPHSPALDFPADRPASLPSGPLAEYGQSHKSAATNRRLFSDSVGWCWTSGPVPSSIRLTLQYGRQRALHPSQSEEW